MPCIVFPNQKWKQTLFGTVAQVRRDINRLVARLVSWSLSVATAGTFPDRGFAGEVFDPKSLRHSLKGKLVANGWRQGPVTNGNCFMVHETKCFKFLFGFHEGGCFRYPGVAPGLHTFACASMLKREWKPMSLRDTTGAPIFVKAAVPKTQCIGMSLKCPTWISTLSQPGTWQRSTTKHMWGHVPQCLHGMWFPAGPWELHCTTLCMLYFLEQHGTLSPACWQTS